MVINVNFDGDLNHAITDLPQVVTIDGTDYNVITEMLTEGQDSAMEGLYGDDSLTVHLRTADLASVDVGEKVTFSGSQYRVTQVNTTPDGAELILGCEEITG